MNPNCPNDCLQQKLPPTNYSYCAPKARLSEFRRIAVAAGGAAPFVNILDVAEWNTRLALPLSNINAVRWLTVIGDMPAATPVSITLSDGRPFNITKTRVVNYTIDDVSDENYEFMRWLECAPTKLRMWPESKGAMLLGGNSGILATNVQNPVFGRGDNVIEVIEGIATWNKKFSPERTVSVMYDGDDAEDEVITYDTVQTFAAAVEAESAGITTTVPAIDPDVKFEFDEIADAVGAATSMTIKIGVTDAAVVGFPADYLGAPFRFTDTNGVAHGGNFAAGNVSV